MNQQKINNMLSIIIPSREVDYLLEDCIKRIRELYKEVQIVIVLDNINKTFPNDKNIKIIKSENPNMSAKRNLGVKNTPPKHEYIAFLDSDAYPDINWAETGLSFLEGNKEYSAVTGNQFNPKEDSFEQKCLRLVRFSPLFTHKEWCIIIDKNTKEQDVTEIMTSNVIMRKKDYIDLNGMNEDIYLAEDNEFSDRLIKQGYRIRFIPKVSVFHRESKLYPFLRKIHCMSYYYANMFIKGKSVKDIKKTLFQFVPLIGTIFYIALWFTNISPYILFALPLAAFIILVKEAYQTSNKLEEKKYKGFFLILFTFCMFCLIWVTGTLLGILNIPVKSVQQCYKHY